MVFNSIYSAVTDRDISLHIMWSSCFFFLPPRVAVVSKSYEGHTDKTEEWYGTQYKQEAISEETIKVNCWSLIRLGPMQVVSCSVLLSRWVLITFPVFQKWQNADLNGKFKLPMKNEFIPTNFEIYPLEKDSPSVPTLIKVRVVMLHHTRLQT